VFRYKDYISNIAFSYRYTAGVDMITYKNDGNTPAALTLSSAVDSSITVDWSSAGSLTNNKYSINLKVVARKYIYILNMAFPHFNNQYRLFPKCIIYIFQYKYRS